jgi:hypothetical protein
MPFLYPCKADNCSRKCIGAWFILSSILLISGPRENEMFQLIPYRVAGVKNPYTNWKVDPDNFWELTIVPARKFIGTTICFARINPQKW